MNYTLTHDNLHIEDSCQVSSKERMENALLHINIVATQKGEDTNIFNVRSLSSMVAEWSAHNLLYSLHIRREQTRSVDINIISKGWDVIYRIVSLFYF